MPTVLPRPSHDEPLDRDLNVLSGIDPGRVAVSVWRRARTKAELPHKLFHDYLRTAARNVIRAGVAQAVAMAITGHKTDSMFRCYNIVSTDDKREALRNVVRFQKPDSDKARTKR